MILEDENVIYLKFYILPSSKMYLKKFKKHPNQPHVII